MTLQAETTTEPPPRGYLRTRISSFGYAFSGLGHMLATQAHARLHLLAVALVCLAGAWLSIPIEDWISVTLVCGLVLAAEAVNTAFEYLCDVVCPARNENVRRCKDVAAAAVLLSAMTALIVGALIVAKNL